jgi:hypothetical protein
VLFNIFIIVGLDGSIAKASQGEEQSNLHPVQENTILVSKKKESTAKTTQKTKVSTSVSFEDLLVQGKYHFSDEAVITVEEDKVLDALLGIRKDFKDRIKRSASRR